MTRRINEIFYSLQGEGAYTGRPAVFIRFSGCNLRCPFCDTDHLPYREMTDAEIVAEAARHGAPLVVLTGGEPSLWIDDAFVAMLKEATGAEISIETNGTRPIPEGIDHVTLSPKAGISGLPDDLPIAITRADEIKVVDLGQDLEPYFRLPCRGEGTRMYLQPCHVADPERNSANCRRSVERVLADPRWTLSLQTHRYLNIP